MNEMHVCPGCGLEYAGDTLMKLRAERDALRADAERCEYIRRNPYRAWDLLSEAIDVNRPAFWRKQFNEAIDAALGRQDK